MRVLLVLCGNNVDFCAFKRNFGAIGSKKARTIAFALAFGVCKRNFTATYQSVASDSVPSMHFCAKAKQAFL